MPRFAKKTRHRKVPLTVLYYADVGQTLRPLSLYILTVAIQVVHNKLITNRRLMIEMLYSGIVCDNFNHSQQRGLCGHE